MHWDHPLLPKKITILLKERGELYEPEKGFLGGKHKTSAAVEVEKKKNISFPVNWPVMDETSSVFQLRSHKYATKLLTSWMR